MIKIICDRCGGEIKSGKIGYVALNFREVPRGDFVADNPFEDTHFCPACMEGITDFITNPAKNEKAEKPTKEEPAKAAAPEPDKATKPRRRIDYGKIMALKDAGWSNAKIADEMGMTSGAVATALSTYRKKMREVKAHDADTE